MTISHYQNHYIYGIVIENDFLKGEQKWRFLNNHI